MYSGVFDPLFVFLFWNQISQKINKMGRTTYQNELFYLDINKIFLKNWLNVEKNCFKIFDYQFKFEQLNGRVTLVIWKFNFSSGF